MKRKKGDFSKHIPICVTIPQEVFDYVESKRKIPNGGKRPRSHAVTEILIEGMRRDQYRRADEGVVL